MTLLYLEISLGTYEPHYPKLPPNILTNFSCFLSTLRFTVFFMFWSQYSHYSYHFQNPLFKFSPISSTLQRSRSIYSPVYQTVPCSYLVGTSNLPIILQKTALFHASHFTNSISMNYLSKPEMILLRADFILVSLCY